MTATPRQKALPVPPQRLAQASDAPAISELMRASVVDLFPHFYDERQTASSSVYIAHLDMQLIEDGTYFVHEARGEIVACGGWSRRNKIYTGSGSLGDDERLLDPATEPARVRAMFVRGDWTRRGLGRAILDACERSARAEGFKKLVLGATLPGEPLYRAFGFREIERFTVTYAGRCVRRGRGDGVPDRASRRPRRRVAPCRDGYRLEHQAEAVEALSRGYRAARLRPKQKSLATRIATQVVLLLESAT